MSTYIPEAYRKLVAQRAHFKCEYCLSHESHTFYRFHVDHIISLKHGGETVPDNLAYACQICNRNKGSDLGTILADGGRIVRFFNPRIDAWEDHFDIQDTGELFAKSEEAEATLKIFGMNHPDSIIKRALLIQVGLFP